MSKIAEALAKAKERTGHTTAPFMSGAPVASPEAVAKKEAAFRRARRIQRFWLVLSSVALVLTALIIWTRLDEMKIVRVGEAEDGAAGISDVRGAASVANPVGPSRVELVNEAPVAVVLPPGNGEATGANALAGPAPKAELQAAVNALVFTAVMPGERPRLMYKGRIVGAGERVEGELVFAGIHDGRLVFNDANGAIYLRRY